MQTAFYVSCSKENEPELVIPENPQEPGDTGKPDDKGDEPSDPSDGQNLNVIVNSDGSTSNGVQFRRINETSFMLNYVRYDIKDGHIMVTGRDDMEIKQTLKGHVDICSSITIDGVKYVVREIYFNAFRYSTALREISIPSTVLEIQNNAFSESVLEKATMSKNVSLIGDEAFYKTNISQIDLPESLTTIGDNAFRYTNISQVKLPKSLTKIGAFAFGDTNITQVDLPESLTIIGCYAFARMKLTSIIIPETVAVIESGAFTSTYIESIRIPDNVKELGLDVVLGCDKLKTIYLPKNLEKFTITEENCKFRLRSLEAIYFLGYNEPRMDIFSRDNDLYYVTLFVPKGYVSKYEYLSYWYRKNLKEFDPDELGLE